MQIQEDNSENQSSMPFPEKKPQSSFKEILKPVKCDTKSAGAVKANLSHQVSSPHRSQVVSLY